MVATATGEKLSFQDMNEHEPFVVFKEIRVKRVEGFFLPAFELWSYFAKNLKCDGVISFTKLLLE